MKILVINAGSSSLKYQLIDMDTQLVVAKGLAERIGMDTGKLTHKYGRDCEEKFVVDTCFKDHTSAIQLVLEALVDKDHGVIADVKEIGAVGHRVLHGGDKFTASCIVDDAACCEASRREILRRLYAARVDAVRGRGGSETVRKLELLMNQADVTPELCPAVGAAIAKAEATGAPAGAMELPDGRVVTGKTSAALGAASALLLNALKAVGGIADQLELISAQVLEPVCRLKTEYLRHKNPRLHTDEVLLALAISALTNPLADLAQQQLPKLRGCEAHFSVILSPVDEQLFKRLGVHVSCEPKFGSGKLYQK